MPPTRPIIRYHGGKWRLADWILSYMPSHKIYTESFGGAGSVLMKKTRSYAEVYNDLDSEVVNLFRVLRDTETAQELKRLLELTPFARAEFTESYESAENPIEQARRTVIRCYMGFGSNAHNTENKTGFRASSNRSGTIPAHDWVNWPKTIEAITTRLQGVVIENRDAKRLIQQHDSPETLHYVDPPYVHTTRTAGNRYRFEMTDTAHQELATTLQNIKGMAIVSGYESSLYEDLFFGWNKITRKAFADGARQRIEALWLNHNVYERLEQKTLFDCIHPPSDSTILHQLNQPVRSIYARSDSL